MSKSKIYELGKEKLQKLVDESYSYAEVFEKLEMNKHGNNYKTLNKVIKEFDIDLSKINENRNKFHANTLKNSRKEIPLDDLITGRHNKEYQGYRLKDRLIKAGLKEYKCERCGLTEWLGEPIPLQLHHKDGNHCNHRLENVELLCPNCHSLTDTFAGRNVKHNKKDINED